VAGARYQQHAKAVIDQTSKGYQALAHEKMLKNDRILKINKNTISERNNYKKEMKKWLINRKN
jgi:hypothetical protein